MQFHERARLRVSHFYERVLLWFSHFYERVMILQQPLQNIAQPYRGARVRPPELCSNCCTTPIRYVDTRVIHSHPQVSCQTTHCRNRTAWDTTPHCPFLHTPYAKTPPSEAKNLARDEFCSSHCKILAASNPNLARHKLGQQAVASLAGSGDLLLAGINAVV